MTARIGFPALVLCLALVGCTADDEGMRKAGGPKPNGIAKMKPAKAMTLTRRAMNDLHDAVYATTVAFEHKGRTVKIRMTETVTADGCLRDTRHPEYGHTWVRVIGRTMWVRANDRAGEVMGRTPAQIELFRGRWLELDAPDLLRGCDLGHVAIPRAFSDRVESRGTTRVDGRRGRRFAVEVEGYEVMCVVATEGPPLVIGGRTVAPAGLLPGFPAEVAYTSTTRLTDTDTGAEVKPPPDRLVIDPSDFQTVPA